MKRLFALSALFVTLVACSGPTPLPRAEASPELIEGIQTFKDSAAVKMLAPATFEKGDNLHSIMVVKDGAGGQFIFVLPSKNSVVVLTAWTANTANELALFREHIYPYL